MKLKYINIFILTAFLMSCSSIEYYKKVSVISNEYAIYNNTHLNPLNTEKVEKYKVGIQKYDNFFHNSSKVYITVQFIKKVIQSYEQKTARNEVSSLEYEAIIKLYKSRKKLTNTCKKLINISQELLKNTRADLKGSNALKIPTVISGLTDSANKLKSCLNEIPALFAKMGQFTNSSDSSYAKTEIKDIFELDSQNVNSRSGAQGKTIYKRAKLKELLNDYELLRDQEFFGSLYPMKFYKMPASIQQKHSVDDKLLLLSTTKSKKIKIIILVPKGRKNFFANKIKSKEKMNFIYKPLDVWKKKTPVVEFVKEYIEDDEEL